MPVNRDLAEDLTRELIELYSQAEARLAADIARRLASGMDRADWAERKLAGIGQLRRAAEAVLRRLENDVQGTVFDTIGSAYQAGGASGLAELARLGGLTGTDLTQIRRDIPGAETVQRLARSLAGRLTGTHLPVLRWDLDAYRQIIGTVSPDIGLGLATRRRTAQVAWERLLSKGITGFTDKANRRWNLATYVEMATRTGVAQAAVEGHLDRLATAGLDLVQVSDSAMECHRCRPWEGKILTRGGPPGRRTVRIEHAIKDGQVVRVTVAGSVDEAIAEGLLHPQCTHSLSAYLPGVTRPLKKTADPEGEAAREKLRDLERRVRRQKLLAGATIDPDAKAGHEVKVRNLQAEIRAHVAANEHLGLRRKPWREQVNLGHTRPPGGAPTPPPRPVVPPDATPFHLQVDELDDLVDAVEEARRTGRRAVLPGGTAGVADVGLVTLPDGRKTVHKRFLAVRGDRATRQADAEQLVSELGRAMGLNLPRVYRVDPASVWMDFIDAPDVASLLHSARDEADLDDLGDRIMLAIDSDQGRIAGLLDLMIANADRHPGNWMFTGHSEFALLDHAYGFGPLLGAGVEPPYWINIDDLIPSSSAGPFARHYSTGELRNPRWADNDLTPADVAELRRRIEALAPAFGHVGRDSWLQFALRVLDAVGRHATGGRNLVA